VGAVALDLLVRADAVAPALRHLLAVLPEDDALVKQLREGLVRRNRPDVEQDLVPEPGVEEVEDGMLRAADVEVRCPPSRERGGRGERLVVPWVREPEVIPARSGP